PESSPSCMRTYKLTLEYEGTRYSGWQPQLNSRTVGGEVIRAAESFFERPVELMGAGRTDAGVHAIGQVAHLKFPRWGSSPAALRNRIERLRPWEILQGLNDQLSADINLLLVEEAPAHFHARHDAVARSYRYRISTRRTAFEKRLVWWVRDRLAVERMEEAASRLVGRHDFRHFSEADPRRPDQSTIVQIETATLRREEHLLLFEVTASHFLWKMVRRLTGALVEVGRGTASVEELVALLSGPGTAKGVQLDPARVTAPPSGLFLDRVHYREAPPPNSGPGSGPRGPKPSAERERRRWPAPR
ncbi:MAG: tRNA pseudouridine(38-40) synthase TruA, partial [Blastocatellia bacterium]